MFRKKIAGSKKQEKDKVKWRGQEVARLEAFSDAVFGFGVTLLIVALEVPETYEELMNGMKGFGSFALSFALIFQIWYSQNLLFRRYGLHDSRTVILNGMLLFTVLFFVYPLKFLFAGMLSTHTLDISNEQMANLICIYSGGFATIYLMFGLMYHNAWRLRGQLNLTDSEAFETRTYMYRDLLVAGLASVSIINALVNKEHLKLSWVPYMLIGLVISQVHSRRNRKHDKMYANIPAMQQAGNPEPVADPVADDKLLH